VRSWDAGAGKWKNVACEPIWPDGPSRDYPPRQMGERGDGGERGAHRRKRQRVAE